MMRVICQFKICTIIVLSLFVLSSKGQVYQSMPQYGYSGPRFNMDSTLSIPTVCGVPTLKSNLTKKAAIAFDSCNNRFYQYNPKTLAWTQISGGGGGIAVDTIYRTPGKDSIQFTIGGRYYSIKDSSGIGVASRLVTTVYNNSGTTILKGSVVYINGRHSSNLPTIALAQANTEANSYSTFAMVQDDILNNNSGIVIQAGNIGNLNLPTSSYIDGQLVYLSPSIAGGITTTKPLAPYHIVKIGTITRAHPTLGSIELKIENGWQLDELSDVKIASVPLDSTILQFSRVDSLWHDVNPTTAMGNRFVKSISRVPGKDSIIFYIGSTRYAIKDSIGGGGGGTPAGSNGYVQFNNSGSFGGNSNFSWNNSNERLGIGVPSPEVKLDVALGQKGSMPLNYEMASFQKNGDTKLGVYTSGTYESGAASAITLGNSLNAMVNGNYPGFEFQNVNDSSNNSGYVRYNYLERNISGNVVAANVNLLNINSNGTVQINPFSYGLSATPRLIIGEDNNGATLETPGNCYIGNGLNVYNGITSNGPLILQNEIRKHVVFWYDNVDGDTYYASDNDNIIIFKTNNDNGYVYLPPTPYQGQEIIVKQAGDVSLGVYIYGNGHNIAYDDTPYTDSLQVPDTAPHSVILVYDSSDGFWYVISYN